MSWDEMKCTRLSSTHRMTGWCLRRSIASMGGMLGRNGGAVGERDVWMESRAVRQKLKVWVVLSCIFLFP